MTDPPKLRKVERLDSIQLDGTYFTDEGYLIDHPIVTSIGIFEYANPDGSIRRELRLPEEVFAKESLDSYKGKPIIITHDAGMVTNENVDDEIIGTILSPGYQDGEHVRAEIVIHNTNALKECELRELSLGYSLESEDSPGEWEGKPYDCIQRNIRINHLALVQNARAGESARLNVDGKDKNGNQQNQKGLISKMIKKRTQRTDENTLTPEELQAAIAMYQAAQSQTTDSEDTPAATQEDEDDTPAPTPQETVQLVKDRKDRRDSEEKSEMTLDEACSTIQEMDEDIGNLLGVIDQLVAEKEFDENDTPSETAADEDKNEDEEENGDDDKSEAGSLNMDSADRLFSKKLEVVRIGDRLNMNGLENMKLLDAQKAIIRKVRPSLRLDGKSDTYIQAAFDLAKEAISKQKSTDTQRQQMFQKDGKSSFVTSGVSSAQKARQKMIERQLNGGK